MEEENKKSPTDLGASPGCLKILAVWGAIGGAVYLIILIDKNTHGGAIQALGWLFLGFVLWMLGRFLFAKGLGGVYERLTKLFFCVVVILIFGAVFSKCGGHGGNDNCAYRVGCW